MTTSLPAALSAPVSGRRIPLFIDHLEYSRRILLRSNPVPWEDPTALSNFLNQAHALLHPDVTLLDLGKYYRAASDTPRLRAAMAARSRVGYALRALLADPETSQSAAAITATVAATTRLPLVLQIPSPRVWLATTHPGDAAELDVDRVEAAAVYVADWLRGFAAVPIAAVLLDDRIGPGHDDAALLPVDPQAYVPVTNVAAHYRWEVGLRRADGVSLGEHVGDVVDPTFWCTADAVVPTVQGRFRMAQLPEAAVPETVLERLALLDAPDLDRGSTTGE
ncbi:hypothetical protein A6F55_24280 [Prescottella equi]|uniref:hypothetical protein n=1 Tax=Rhodococcus hoagii TaxID=43767 RepID=UPI000A1036AC|nr:hypothetical protein [Prescottella equi]ORJ92266.1 hypothetical protein A6F55_24280 [Prescottella equi]